MILLGYFRFAQGVTPYFARIRISVTSIPWEGIAEASVLAPSLCMLFGLYRFGNFSVARTWMFFFFLFFSLSRKAHIPDSH